MSPIPIYDSPQAQNAPLDAARLNPGMAPNPTGAIGQGLAHAAEGFGQILQQAETLKGEDRLNQLQSKKLEKLQWVQSLRGNQTITPEAYGGDPGTSLHKTALGWFDADAAEARQGLTGHALEVFNYGAARFRLDLEGHVLQHEGMQSGVVAKDTYDGTMAIEDKAISQNAFAPDGRLQEDTITQSINRKVFAAQQLSDFLGEGADTRKARELEATSGGYAIVAHGLVTAGRPGEALRYLQANASGLTPAALSTMNTLAKNASVQQQSLAVVNKLMDQATTHEGMGPVGPNGEQPAPVANNPFAPPPSEFEMIQRLRKENLAPEVFEKALPLLREFRGAKAQDTVQAQNDFYGSQIKARLDGTPSSSIMSSTQVMSMPEGVQADLQAKLHSIDQQKKAEGAEARTVAHFAAYWAYASNPQRLAQMSDTSVFALVQEVGVDGVKDLLHAKQQMAAGPGRVLASNVDTNQLKVLADQAGIQVFDNPTSGITYTVNKKEAEQVLGRLKSQVDQQIEVEQQAKGHELTRAEKDNIIKRNLVTYVTQPLPGGFRSAIWGPLTGNYLPDPVPKLAFQLDPTDRLAIPLDRRQAIIAEAQAHGVPNPTEQQIQNRWFQLQQPAPAASLPQLVHRNAPLSGKGVK
jgi:hypothetical protein